MVQSTESFTAELSSLDIFDRSELIDRWREVIGAPPPKHLSIGFMKRALSYELQCRALGGVFAKTESALKRLAARGDAEVFRSRIAPGAHLIREWNGRTYQVEVLEKGYRMDGKTYASLSAIAKRITGAHWSGPRFFGVST